MSDGRLSPDDPREWLNRAKSNLTQARTRVAGIYLEDLCFAAQQAAEKATKAVLIHLGINFPRVHDITRLLTLIEQNGQRVPDGVKAAGVLSSYAVASRYPGIAEPVTEGEYSEALTLAERLVQWAETVIKKGQSKE